MRTEKPYKRTDRIEHQILEIFGEIATKYIDLSHLGFVTFTKAQITNDFMYVKVFFSIINPRLDREDLVEGINKLRGPFRKYLAPELHIKNIPEIEFLYDDSIEYTEKIERLISTIKNDN